MSASPRKPVGFLTSFPVLEGKEYFAACERRLRDSVPKNPAKGCAHPLETRGFGATTALQIPIYPTNASTISITPHSQPRSRLREVTIFLPSRQPSDTEAIPARKESTHRSGIFILPSPALIPVTSESADSATASAAASAGEMLFELSLSAEVPSKRRVAGLLCEKNLPM